MAQLAFILGTGEKMGQDTGRDVQAFGSGPSVCHAVEPDVFTP